MIRPTPRKAPPMPRRLLSAAAACTLLLGLAACGEGGDGPVTTPPPSIDIAGPSDGGGDGGGSSDGGGDEASPSAAPEVPAPDPADYPWMDKNTEEGAQQFTRYFFALLIWGYQTGESADLETLYSDNCQTCESNVEPIRKYSDMGEKWTPVTIEDVAVENLPVADNEFDVAVHYEAIVSEHDEPSLDGGEPSKLPALHYRIQSGLVWTEDGWLVDDAALELDAA